MDNNLKEIFENNKLDYLKNNATYKIRLSKKPKLFVLDKKEMKNEKGWFKASRKYKLPIYYSGWIFNKKKDFSFFKKNYVSSEIHFRISPIKKSVWLEEANKSGMTLTDYIKNAVEGNFNALIYERAINVLKVQDNYFKKVETNINQFAKVANQKNYATEENITAFNNLLKQVAELKKEQNKLFSKIFKLIANDS